MTAIIGDQGFWIAAGASGTAVVVIIAAHALTARWWGGAGGAVIVGVLAGTLAVARVPVLLAGGIALLAVAGASAARRSHALSVVATAAGAVLVAIGVTESAPDAPDWVPLFIGVAAVVTSHASRTFDSDSPRLTGLCLAITSAGIYAVVPDTELALVLLGAAAVSAFLGLARNLAPTPSASTAVMGLVVWNAGVGGWPRDSAVVGAVACVGIVALGAFVRHLRVAPPLTVAVHVCLVVIAARVAGMTDGPFEAAGIAALAFAGATLLLLAVGRAGS